MKIRLIAMFVFILIAFSFSVSADADEYAFEGLITNDSALYQFHEVVYGPVGIVLGIAAAVLLVLMSRKVGGILGSVMKLYSAALIVITIGALILGLHGANVLDGVTTRFFERTLRMSALVLAIIGSVYGYWKMR